MKRARSNTLAYDGPLRSTMPLAHEAEKAGLLMKENHGWLGVWKERYFVLHDAYLYYSDSPSSDIVLGVFDLTQSRLALEKRFTTNRHEGALFSLLLAHSPHPFTTHPRSGQAERRCLIVECSPNGGDVTGGKDRRTMWYLFDAEDRRAATAWLRAAQASIAAAPPARRASTPARRASTPARPQGAILPTSADTPRRPTISFSSTLHFLNARSFGALSRSNADVSSSGGGGGEADESVTTLGQS